MSIGIVDIAGWAAFALSMVALVLKGRRYILFMNATANLFWVTHYAMLPAVTAAAVASTGTARDFLMAFGAPARVAIGFFVLAAILGAWTATGPIALLPVLGHGFYTLASICRSTRFLRLYLAAGVLTWALCHFLIGSIPGLICDAITFAAWIVGWVMHERPTRKPATEDKE